MAYLFVGAGGFTGACLRYLLTRLLSAALPDFPYGTLLSNIIAALAVGFILGWERQTAALPVNAKLFLTTGIMGGLSTFSTFSLETVTMLEKGRFLMAGGNILLNVALSLLFALVGMTAARIVLR